MSFKLVVPSAWSNNEHRVTQNMLMKEVTEKQKLEEVMLVCAQHSLPPYNDQRFYNNQGLFSSRARETSID